MKQQQDLFDNPITQWDPNVVPAESPRLSRQCKLILARLLTGTASNRELADLALKYTSRVSDLRAAGFDVRVVREDHRTGIAMYALFEDGKQI